MAQTLPTVTVTDAQAQRILAAFTNMGSGTPVQNYKAWLVSSVKEEVYQYEMEAAMATLDQARTSKRASVDNDLGAIS